MSEREIGMLAKCPRDPGHQIVFSEKTIQGAFTVRCTQCTGLEDGSADIGPWKPRPDLFWPQSIA